MKAAILAVALFAGALVSPAVWAGPADEVRALYDQFVTAQNARDVRKVRSLLLDSPKFLWVSDGKTFWGPDTMVERMASFQQAEIWQVDPALEKSVAVEVGADAAYLHLPLQLTIGFNPTPDKLKFLVSMLCVKTDQGWRIAALFTTTEKMS
jgi:hypothetical protein